MRNGMKVAFNRVKPADFDGLFFGNSGQVWIQFISIAATMIFAFLMTSIILSATDLITVIRVSELEENRHKSHPPQRNRTESPVEGNLKPDGR